MDLASDNALLALTETSTFKVTAEKSGLTARATGNLLWQFGNGGVGNSTDDGINSPWGLLPTMISAIADGKVYAYSQQHGNGAQSPYYKGERIWVLNATTGEQIWTTLFQGPK